MKILFIITVLFLFAQQQSTAQTNTYTSKQIPLIELKGSAHERGLQHGSQLKKEIAEVFAKWKSNIRAATQGDPDSVLTAFLKATDFGPATKKYTPGIWDELKGIAEASGQKFDDVFAFQLVDEFWVYLDKQYNEKKHHCSGMGVSATPNHPAYIAQNTDLESYMNGYQVLLHIVASKNESEQYILSCAGLVALNGMNSAGIGLCVNTLMELEASTDGLPVAFIIRNILSRQKGNEALDFLKTIKHASGQNYILGIADSVYDFEASSKQVVRFFPKERQSAVIYHTNHALANHTVKEWYQSYHQRVLAGQTKNGNSEVRFATLEKYMDKKPDEISADIIKTTLRSKDNARNPVCRSFSEGGGFTFSSTVFTLSGKRSVQLTYGSPDQSDYKEYFFAGKNN